MITTTRIIANISSQDHTCQELAVDVVVDEDDHHESIEEVVHVLPDKHADDIAEIAKDEELEVDAVDVDAEVGVVQVVDEVEDAEEVGSIAIATRKIPNWL